eukprot:TRINITY_DN25340_c0_g1_i1.p1 TRINITY_DN25340_c0_g1~~TRINITY_DN25340_c0_g1_i1.p1  ORF type:complete len:184 (+),score=40.89 TRINITY_DN25340_c0_g1_i1:70-552(+)
MAVHQEDGKRWLIEKKEKEAAPIYVKDHDTHHTLLIFKCSDITVVVEKKINSVSIDACKNVQVVMADVVSTVEVTNSQKVKFQVTGSCPSASIDKTDSCMVFLMSEEAKKMQISTSKHSDVQITYMKDDEPVECPVPEQFVHTIGEDGKIQSTVSSLYSS